MTIPQAKEVFAQNMTVRCYEQDPSGRLRPADVFNWFQEAACGQCRQHKAAIEDLRPRGYTWIIHRYKIVVARMPLYGEDCRVSTWAHPRRDLLSVRDFALESLSGERLVSGTSQWALIDLAAQRPARLSAAVEHFPACGARSLDEDLRPLNVPPGLELLGETGQKATAWCLDQNEHVNNSVYVSWAYDGLYPHIKGTPALREMEVNYKHQAFHGQAVVCRTSAAPGGVFYSEISLGSGEPLALIRSAWSA